MQVRNKIKISTYLLGTILNLGSNLLMSGGDHRGVISIFYCCLVLNQYFLLAFGSKFLNLDEKEIFIPTPILAVVKLFILVFGFYYAYLNAPNLIPILVISYIIQLIILALSTKRVIKKN